MRIAVDAMGGDFAPREIIRGVEAGLSYLSPDDELHVFGPQDVVQEHLRALGISDRRVVVQHCPQVIGMDDSPVEALKTKRDSSIVRMASAAGKGELDAIISAGNTGAFAAAAQLRIGTIKGVSRPGIAVTMPTFSGPVLLCDVGANVSPKAQHLYEYAQMCSVYARELLHISQPKVGIISVGEEDTKGNDLVKKSHALIKSNPALHFVGNVEGRDIFGGKCHVFICDGFVGNVILKQTEGLAEGLFKTIIREIEDAAPNLVATFHPIVDRIWRKHDFAEYGGAPLLGINSVVIICHGRSDHRAIGNAVRFAREQHRVQLNAMIARSLDVGEPAA